MKKRNLITLGEAVLGVNFEVQSSSFIPTEEYLSPQDLKIALGQRRNLRKSLNSQIAQLVSFFKIEDVDKRQLKKLVNLLKFQCRKLSSEIRDLNKYKTYYF